GDGQRATKHGFAGLDGGAASSTMRGTIGAQPLAANHSHLRDVGRASHPGDEPVAVDGFAVNRRAVRLFAGGEKGIYLSRTRPPGILTRGSRLANSAAKPDKRAYTDLEAIMSSGTPVVGHLPARRRIRKDPGEPIVDGWQGGGFGKRYGGGGVAEHMRVARAARAQQERLRCGSAIAAPQREVQRITVVVVGDALGDGECR